MGTHPLTDDQIFEAVELIREHGGVLNASMACAGRNGYSRSALDNKIRVGLTRGIISRDPTIPGFYITKVTTKLDADGNVAGEHIQQKPEQEPYRPAPGQRIKGVSSYVNGRGETIGQWIKAEATNLPVEDIKAAFEDFEWKPVKIPAPKKTDKDLLTIYPIADLHHSLRATAEESGEDYNLDIAEQVFNEKTDQLFLKSQPTQTAIVAYLGDWTHQNSDFNVTPRSGFSLDVSDNLYQTVRRGVKMAIAHIHKALQFHRHVIVKVLKGNHDLDSWIALVIALEQHFASDKRVTVDTSDGDYWFFRFGVNLLGFHHGHRMKPEQMAVAMAHECRQDWGETFYRLFLHGHLHHKRQLDVMGVLIECFRTLAPPDSHHAGKYGSPRSLTSITLHREDGEVDRSFVNLRPVSRRAVQV